MVCLVASPKDSWLLLGKRRWEIPVDEKVNNFFWWFIGHFYTIHFSISWYIMSNHRITSFRVLLVANRSTCSASAWFVAYDGGWSTWKKNALWPMQKLYHGIFPYILDIAIFIQNIWEYTMLYSIYIHIVAHVRQHGMCFATSELMSASRLELGIVGAMTPRHIGNPTVLASMVCRCSLGFTLISSNQLIANTTLHYYMLYICIYIYSTMITVTMYKTVWDGNKRTIHGAPDNHMFLKGPF
jgi:hypothetical protein